MEKHVLGMKLDAKMEDLEEQQQAFRILAVFRESWNMKLDANMGPTNDQTRN